MKSLDPQISELCRRVRIIDYLQARGIEVIRSGNRWRCICPLPDHEDHDPSFYIRTTHDGAEIFHCFGCSKSGNILTLMAAMENQKIGQIIKKISTQAGIIIGKFDPSARFEPLPEEVLEMFCDEQEYSAQIAQIAVEFLKDNPSEDAVNKISRMYEMLDKMSKEGDMEGIRKYMNLLCSTIDEYHSSPDVVAT